MDDMASHAASAVICVKVTIVLIILSPLAFLEIPAISGPYEGWQGVSAYEQ
jgi:hypothetical protein